MRRNRLGALALSAAAVCLATGCQTMQLKHATLNQVASYGEVQERQVLDNLAKFVYDINSLPSFSYADQGTNSVADTVSGSSTSTFMRIAAGAYRLASITIVPSASRLASQNWVLKPVNDPRRLDLMRCAYQKVVRANLAARGLQECSPCPPCDGGTCPDCTKRFNTFYTGGADTPPAAPGDPKDGGRVTHLCLGTNPTWFAWGCKKDVPKGDRCLRVAHYCGVYVWVLPGGEDELAKLTLAIADYAVNVPAEAPKTPTKEVTIYLDALGKSATASTATQVIKGTVPVDQAAGSLILVDLDRQLGVLQPELARKTAERNKMTNKSSDEYKALDRSVFDLESTIFDLKRQRQDLTPLPPLPAPYRPSIDESSGNGLLELQNRLRSVQPPGPVPVP